MELKSIRGGTIQNLQDNKYTIGIGISLGNRWFTVENIIDLIEWSFKYSKNKVVVYVADSIHAINIEVRNRISHRKAVEKANKMGDKIIGDIKIEAQKVFSEETNSRIVYVRWDEIVDDAYKHKVDFLRSLYVNNQYFKDYIISIIEDFIFKEERIFSDNEIYCLGKYIIEELPELINRVTMKGVVCDAYTYPFDGKLCEFVEKIQNGEIFPEIRDNIMDTKPKVFLEVR